MLASQDSKPSTATLQLLFRAILTLGTPFSSDPSRDLVEKEREWALSVVAVYTNSFLYISVRRYEKVDVTLHEHDRKHAQAELVVLCFKFTPPLSPAKYTWQCSYIGNLWSESILIFLLSCLKLINNQFFRNLICKKVWAHVSFVPFYRRITGECWACRSNHSALLLISRDRGVNCMHASDPLPNSQIACGFSRETSLQESHIEPWPRHEALTSITILLHEYALFPGWRTYALRSQCPTLCSFLKRSACAPRQLKPCGESLQVKAFVTISRAI